MDTHRLRDREHLPSSRVDWDESRRQQLLLLRVVASAGVKQLINADLNGTAEMWGVTAIPRAETLHFTELFSTVTFESTYLAEMVPVKCHCCLRSQLEKMELCGEDLLSSGHRGQIEPVLHLFTAHCMGNDIVREQKNATIFHELQ